MKSFAAGWLAAGLLIAFVGGCKEKTEEPVAQAPEQAPPPSFPEAQVPRPEPQPAHVPAEPPPPVDTTANAPPSEHEAPAPEPMPKENYARPERKTTQTYVVKKGDTLQKISQKFYGTTKSWRKIYQANKKTMKDPDKVAEGDKLIIP